uniref:lysozyme n=1 Tax=Timema bartmani TaxID=61472 RepID=A0A7R9F5M1_9NEOP|nr:unnamed protein product [Timema bartmani]
MLTDAAVFISNLSPACVRCLCEAATECNNTFACIKGYCGPFYISKVYWIEAGRPVLDEDDPERTRAYEDCATDITCAARILEAYMVKYGRDCNGDNVTNCDDYARIHYHGGTKCESPLDENTFSRRYSRCRPEQSEAVFHLTIAIISISSPKLMPMIDSIINHSMKQMEYPMKGHYDGSTENLIHQLQCNYCIAEYVGLTTGTLRQQMNARLILPVRAIR